MSLSSGDIEKISVDKSLAGKVPDPINRGGYHMMVVVIVGNPSISSTKVSAW